MSFIALLITGFFVHAAGPEVAKKEVVYNKTPKSLFLIKKAKVDADVGEAYFKRRKSSIPHTLE